MGSQFSSNSLNQDTPEPSPDPDWKPAFYFSLSQKQQLNNDENITSDTSLPLTSVVKTVRIKNKLFPKPLQQQEQIHQELESYREELRSVYEDCTKAHRSMKWFLVGFTLGLAVTATTHLKLPLFLCSTGGATLDFYSLYQKCMPYRDRTDKLNIVAKKMDLLLEKEKLKGEIERLKRENSVADDGDALRMENARQRDVL